MGYLETPLKYNNKSLVAVLSLIISTSSFAAIDLSGLVGLETRYFIQTPVDSEQTDEQVSLNFRPELYWEGDDQSVLFKPYVRLDSVDSNRSHFDIREAIYSTYHDTFELKVGIGKVFWGVTETLNLVDVVNQNDAIDRFDENEKLGQPMFHFSTFSDWGNVELLILPFFRPVIFPGDKTRFRPTPIVLSALNTIGRSNGIGPPYIDIRIDNSDPTYEAKNDESHIDLASRWTNSIENWDLGVSWFNGTSRDPSFNVSIDSDVLSTGQVTLKPFYPLINQFGIDTQYIYDDWILKLESINRSGDKIKNYTAFVTGFEYNFYGIQDSMVDIGMIVEYAWDSRDKIKNLNENMSNLEDIKRQIESNNLSINRNNISVASRFTFNDAESSELLIGTNQNLDYKGSRTIFIDISTRVGESTKISANATFIWSDDPFDPGYMFRQDDYIQVTAEYYF